MTCDIHWVAANIVKFDEMKSNPPMQKHKEDDDNDELKPRARPTTMIQQINDEDDDNAVIDDDKDDGEEDDEDDNDNDDGNDDNDDHNNTASLSANTKTLNTMKKLVTSYNPYAMDYINCHLLSEDTTSEDTTVQQDNRLEREEEDDKVTRSNLMTKPETSTLPLLQSIPCQILYFTQKKRWRLNSLILPMPLNTT